MKDVADFAFLLLFGLGYAAFITAPMVLIMPFVFKKSHHTTKDPFMALAAGIATVLFGSIPMMHVSMWVTAPAFANLDNSTGALDGTGLAFTFFFFGMGVTLASLLAIWIEKVMLR